ncbi:MAG TPA: organomercurial lyase [Anaerolineales bacterium]|nr:organomercurial lyase [Anaerolineales bacterium]
MDFDTNVKLAIYDHFATTGDAPSPAEVATSVEAEVEDVLESYRRLRAQRLLVLETDESSIRMAPPFSGVPTQHIVEADGIRYFANCAWDALGVPAALQKAATVHSRCAQSGEPLDLYIGLRGPEQSDWLFHCLVPAAKWWDDIVFT